jgi:hypothetical protein
MSNFFLVKNLSLENNFINNINNKLKKSYKEQSIIERSWSIAEIYTSSLVMISRLLVL